MADVARAGGDPAGDPRTPDESSARAPTRRARLYALLKRVVVLKNGTQPYLTDEFKAFAARAEPTLVQALPRARRRWRGLVEAQKLSYRPELDRLIGDDVKKRVALYVLAASRRPT